MATRTSTRKRTFTERARYNNPGLSPTSEGDGDDSDSTDTSPSVRPVPSLRSLPSASSSASLLEGPNVNPPTPSEPLDKRSKFDARFKTGTQSDEEVLNAQMKTWTSSVYSHYVMPPTIVREGEVVKYVFVCKTRPSISLTCTRHDESTSNLGRHVSSCTPADSKEARALATYAHGTTYTPQKLQMKLAIWVARRNRPFAIVADPELIEIFTDLNSSAVVPSPKTISRDVKEIFVMSREVVIQVLKAYPGKIHLCADGWTSPQVLSFLGVTAHWIDKGDVISIILDFVRASKSHTGEYMAGRIAELIHTYGIQDKLLSFVCDNASNNDTLVDALEQLVPSFGGADHRVRCFAHIINLVVKAVLSQFAKTKKEKTAAGQDEKDDEDLEDGVVGDEEDEDESGDEDEIDPSVAASDQAMVDEVAHEVELDLMSPTVLEEDTKLGRFTLYKLRTLANKIVHSPTIRADLEQACITCKIPPKIMCRDVSTRWNSTCSLIARSRELCQALNLLVLNKNHNKPRGVRLQRFQLSEKEWQLLDELHPLLDVFLTATKRISTNKVALIHEVIPIIDIISGLLTDFSVNEALLPAVRAAAARGLKMMNKYYSKTDDSVVYRIAMILHPRYKTSYFTRQNWPMSWIDTAIEVARTEWEKYKLTAVAPILPTTGKERSLSDRLFDELNNPAPSTTDPFDDWVTSTPMQIIGDPIQWWTAMENDGNPLAPLAWMALDYLSIPATSTDVERAFSRGGLTVSKMRHSLSEESTQASTVLGSWVDCRINLIPRDKILAALKAKSKRSGESKAKDSVPVDTEMIVVD